MTNEERELQLDKIALIRQMIILLEAIAFQTSVGVFEKDKYLEGLYASGKSGATEVHGNLRTRSCTCKGPLPKPAGSIGVQQHFNTGAAKI